MAKTSFTLKVSLARDLYRIIKIDGNSSLYDLAEFIIKAFDFEFDHAFGFYDNPKDIYKSKEIYELFVDNGMSDNSNAKSVKKTKITNALSVGKKMLFLFDYGDDWGFLLECQKKEDIETKIPEIIKSVGSPPQQYPDYEEDD